MRVHLRPCSSSCCTGRGSVAGRSTRSGWSLKTLGLGARRILHYCYLFFANNDGKWLARRCESPESQATGRRRTLAAVALRTVAGGMSVPPINAMGLRSPELASICHLTARLSLTVSLASRAWVELSTVQANNSYAVNSCLRVSH